MIKNPEYLIKWEASLPPLTPHQAMAILDSLWEEACALGIWPPDDPLDGIENHIRIAEILKSCSKN